MNDLGDLLELAELVGEDRVRRALLSANASPRSIATFDRVCAERFAEQLCHERLDKKVIVVRLAIRYQFSQATCYRLADRGRARFLRFLTEAVPVRNPQGTMEAAQPMANRDDT